MSTKNTVSVKRLLGRLTQCGHTEKRNRKVPGAGVIRVRVSTLAALLGVHRDRNIDKHICVLP